MLLHAMVCTKAFRWARRCWVFFQKVTWTLVCILGIYQKGCCFNIQAAVFSMCLAYAECAFVLKLSSNFGWISVCRGAATDIHWGNWQWLSLSWSQGHPRSDADDSWNLEKGESTDETNPTWSVLRLRWACFVPLQLESTLPSCHVSLPGHRSLMFYHSLYTLPGYGHSEQNSKDELLILSRVLYFLILFQWSWRLCYRRTGGEICFYPGFVLISVIIAANLGHLGKPFFGSLQV